MIAPDPSSPAHVDALDSILRDWLSEPELVVICGRWNEGAVSELMSHGHARLSSGAYEGRFSGLRDLRLDGERHHLHLDLSKFDRAEYVVWPSVCYGWKPSFEMHLSGDNGPGNFAVSIGRPYDGDTLRRDKVRVFFERFSDHRRRFGDMVQASARSSRAPASRQVDAWREVARCAQEVLSPNGSIEERFDDANPLESVQFIMRTMLENAGHE